MKGRVSLKTFLEKVWADAYASMFKRSQTCKKCQEWMIRGRSSRIPMVKRGRNARIPGVNRYRCTRTLSASFTFSSVLTVKI
jgi:hypothetical protein